MKFSVFQVSRKGGREKNEDRMGYCYARGSGLFLLADGMGGHPQGEVAAQMALQTMSALYQKEARPEVEDVSAFLSNAVMAAHRQILTYTIEKGMFDSPRTTIVAALVQHGCITWVHCGDSRLYLVRDGELLARTRAAQRSLAWQFQQRRVEKGYEALVTGHLQGQGTIDLPLAADWPNRPRQRVDHEAGKPSQTRWSAVSFNARAGHTRLALAPETGRTHQLRVHLLAIGHPIVGDLLYGQPDAGRLMLHASALAFEHPVTGERVALDDLPPF